MCNCIKQINETLVEYNTELVHTLPIKMGTRTRVIIATRKIESSKRKGPISVLPSYCPFCGEEYVDDDIPKQNNTTNLISEA